MIIIYDAGPRMQPPWIKVQREAAIMEAEMSKSMGSAAVPVAGGPANPPRSTSSQSASWVCKYLVLALLFL